MTTQQPQQPQRERRPFRFGVSLRSAADRDGWLGSARRAEELGYDIALIPDHIGERFPPLLALAAIAEQTRLRIGTFVLNNDFRHPAFVAREAATLDLLSGGRFELGLGAGHMESEYREIGLAFDPAVTRIERLEESVSVLKRLFAGEDVSVSGRHYTLAGHRLFPMPVQRPRPPILIGGNSRRALALAGREADIVGLVGFSLRNGGRHLSIAGFTEEQTAARIEWVREAAGARFAALELNALVQEVVITQDAAAIAAEKAAELAEESGSALSPADLLTSAYIHVGTVDEIVAKLRRQRDALGISYVVVHQPFMEALAPVVQVLAGH
jgi:probable F420-dependent oxidoreductase